MSGTNGEQGKERLVVASVFVVSLVGSIAAHRPSRYYFFGDSWGVLHELLMDWKNILHPHNESFMPLFKAFYLFEYRLFGANHFLYSIAGFALYAANATLVYLFGRRLSLRPWPAVAAGVIFTFSWVHFDVPAWSFEQCFSLSTLFLLMAVVFFYENPTRTKTLVWVGVLSLAAYWSAPIALALPLILFVCFFLWLANHPEPVGRAQVFKTLLAIGLPFTVYLASLRATMTFASVLAINKAHLSLYNLPTVIDLTLFSVTQGLLLRNLTFPITPPLASGPVIILLVFLFLGFCYRLLISEVQRRAFWFLACFPLLSLFVVCWGRMQWGPVHLLSHRYQYLPMTAFALLIGLCGQALRSRLRERRTQLWFTTATLVLLAYYLVFHIHMIRRVNPIAYWGVRAKEFLRLARQATYPNSVPPGGAVLGPELVVPDYVHAPGPFPLWKVFQVLEGNTRTVVPVAGYLRGQDATLVGNLVRNGGFEEPLAGSAWASTGGTTRKRTETAAHAGRFGAEVKLPGTGSALSQDAIQNCPSVFSGRIFTFSVQAKTKSAEVLQASILFKDRGGNVLGEFQSSRHPGGDTWSPLVVSGLSPENTCIVSVSVENAGTTEISALLDDAIVLAHPAALDREGKLVVERREEIGPLYSGQWASQLGGEVTGAEKKHGK